MSSSVTSRTARLAWRASRISSKEPVITVMMISRRNLGSLATTSTRMEWRNNSSNMKKTHLPVLASHFSKSQNHNNVLLSVRFKSTASPKDIARSNNNATKSDEQKTTTTNNKNFLWDLGLPSLLPDWKRMFHKDTLFTDISAGITVGCIAVPLSLAIAVASGVPAEVGLVTAAVSGVAGGLFGGTTLAVTGPAAAISLLVAGAVQQHGLEALPLITLGCGGLQVLSGVTRLGVVAKLVPVSVIAGFTTGVGTLILAGQLPKALGMVAPPGMNPVEVVSFIGQNVAAIKPEAAVLALGTAAAMYALPKVHPKMPSALLAVGGATLATHTMGLDVALIGSIPSGLEAFQFGMPVMPGVEALPSLAATTFLIYGMTSVESLLSCAALEKMKKTPYKHSPDQELVGQGLANVGSALFMGMPVTSVIARSSLNVRLNAETRLPAIVQSGFVFSSVVFVSSSIAMIPMPALSGMLIMTGAGMLNPAEFKHCYAVQKSDTIPFLTTIAGMLSLGLAEGIGIGCLSAVALNYKGWSSQNTQQLSKLQVQEALPMSQLPSSGLAADGLMLQQQRNFHDNANHRHYAMDEATAVWHLRGPINFLSMFEIDNMMDHVKQRKQEAPLDNIVLDMHGVTSLEFTGVEELVTRLIEAADGTPIKMVNCSDPLMSALDQCDPGHFISRGNLQEEENTIPFQAAAKPDTMASEKQKTL